MEATSPEGYMYYYNTETGGEFWFTQDDILDPILYMVVFMHPEYQEFIWLLIIFIKFQV